LKHSERGKDRGEQQRADRNAVGAEGERLVSRFAEDEQEIDVVSGEVIGVR